MKIALEAIVKLSVTFSSLILNITIHFARIKNILADKYSHLERI